MGASVIEKHLTLDRNMDGPDHQASIEPTEFADLVSAIRDIEKSFGRSIKSSGISERKNLSIARKSIVAQRDIIQGEEYTEDNLTTKRPGTGLSPMMWDEMIGRKAN